jgi:hypothetical protein
VEPGDLLEQLGPARIVKEAAGDGAGTAGEALQNGVGEIVRRGLILA